MAEEELVIRGWRIEPRLLNSYSLRRCGLGECRGWCCASGVWADVEHKEKVLAHADLVRRYLPIERHDERAWFEAEIVEDDDFPSGKAVGTNAIPRPDHPAGSACVFLRGDYRCALQMAGAENGMGPLGLKPFFCALHPLTIGDGKCIELDSENEIYIGGGSCQRIREQWQLIPLYELLDFELKLVLGEDGYQELCAAAREQRQA